ncbi:bifunctional riboflavin kinase/FAD synthetase [Capillimicrobium parvum]|uniref:Riboflavin biosynthesis protein n=1 Tax=Capillimicrobium parvum TaxID=2884022 RepID=A0A9E7C1L7_9ACTN|nr:bifunctional riboflavin kinase/FAD synthetase [Capillimicrobium parvum]UGS36732.1 Bifunctional riboflavin kinase/FMN adenylyltransferase [Capillimicrobium parvum]
MKITALTDAEPRPRKIALGTFDGVHLGHRAVIEGSDTVVTFEPHPLAVIAPRSAPRLLTSLERKAQLVSELGVEELVVVTFDDELASVEAEQFVDRILVDALQATHVSVGENFRFGHLARGDADLLAADDRFETRVSSLLEIDGEIVSSSHIRGLITGGAVAYAGRLLDRPFRHRGEVVDGDKRGRELGFPTANLVPPEGYVIPGHGVYACVAWVPGLEDGEAVPVPAAVNIGVRPQFQSGRGELIEAFLIDWSGDLYGAALALDFHKRLRGERRFPSVDDLVAQMDRDVEAALATVSGRT